MVLNFSQYIHMSVQLYCQFYLAYSEEREHCSGTKLPPYHGAAGYPFGSIHSHYSVAPQAAGNLTKNDYKTKITVI